MECLLCYFESDEQTLKLHYEVVHNVDPTNPHFRNLFEPPADVANKKCGYCGCKFLTAQEKKPVFFDFTIVVQHSRLEVEVGQRI